MISSQLMHLSDVLPRASAELAHNNVAFFSSHSTVNRLWCILFRNYDDFITITLVVCYSDFPI